MDKDLETYNVQLSQVELALVSDPGNTELTSLQTELKELIALTEQEIAQSEKRTSASKSSASSSKPSTSSTSFLPGDDVLAKYSGDNSWYPARITSVGGSEDNRVYSVVFKGYNSTEVVQAGSIKPLPPGYQASSSVGTSIGKRKGEQDAERERKKKKSEKKAEVRAEKAKEQNEKQASWLKFAKKAEKKGVPIAGLSGTSIFKSPDNPHGRVGVTGSGKGMTETSQRQRHKYAAD